MTFAAAYDKIDSLNRGADEHEYPPRRQNGKVLSRREADGKGISAEAPFVCPNGSLGAKVNTLATVTDVENYSSESPSIQGQSIGVV